MRCGLCHAVDSTLCSLLSSEVGIHRDRACLCCASARSAHACTVAALHGCSCCSAQRGGLWIRFSTFGFGFGFTPSVRIAELLCPRFCAVVESCLGLRDAVTPWGGSLDSCAYSGLGVGQIFRVQFFFHVPL